MVGGVAVGGGGAVSVSCGAVSTDCGAAFAGGSIAAASLAVGRPVCDVRDGWVMYRCMDG